jgi:hypothetical protein
MTDELLYEPAQLPDRLVPYRCGLPCWHRLREEPDAETGAPAQPQEPALSA